MAIKTLASWVGGLKAPAWQFVAFTSGGTVVPALGDSVNGDSSVADAILEYVELTSGSWAGGDAAGFLLLSNWNGSAWTSGETFTFGSDAGSNHGTFTLVPADNFAVPTELNNIETNKFNDQRNDVLILQSVMPRGTAGYGGNGVTMRIGIFCPGAITLDSSWKGFFKSCPHDAANLAAEDGNAKPFASPQSNTSVVAPTVDGNIVYFDITHSDGAQMDNVSAGEMFLYLLMRDAQDGTNDDMTVPAHFATGEMFETS